MASLEEAQRLQKVAKVKALQQQAPGGGTGYVGSDQGAGRGQGSLTEGLRAVDDFGRGMADTFTFGLADEIAAGAGTVTGLGEGGSYEENLATERARDEAAGPGRTAGQITGALTGAAGIGRAGLSLLRGAQPTVKSLAARGAAEGALYGGAYGAGSAEGGPQARAEGALWGSLLGALTGGGTGAVAGKMAQGGRAKAPSVSSLKSQGGAAYDRAFNSGVTLKPGAFDTIADDLAFSAKQEGFHPKIHPKVSAALDEVTNAKGGTPTLQDVDNLRRVLKQASGSIEKAERRLAGRLIEQLDDALENLTPGDVLAGNVGNATQALKDARGLWQRASKGDTIEGLIRRAEDRATQFSGSGRENALRTEFRGLAMNEKRMRLFSKTEQEAIRRVAKGDPIGNVLRFVGKAAPRGVVSGGFHLGVAGVTGNPLLGAATMGVGELGRQGATLATRANARAASELMRAGGRLPPPQALLPAQKNILEALLLSQSQQNVNALDPLMANRGR
jgi:hypothetical protein